MTRIESLAPAYVRAVQEVLADVHREAVAVEVAYLKRLTGFAAELAAVPPPGDAAPQPGIRERAAAIGSMAHRARAFFACVEQAVRVLVASRRGHGIVLGLATRRLLPPAGALGPRRELALLAKHNGPGFGRVGEMINAAGHILVMDVQPVSRIWGRHRAFWREGVFIVDGMFACLFFLALFVARPAAALRAAARLLRDAVRAAAEAPAGKWRAATTMLFYGVVTSTYGFLIERFDARAAVSFTCNSRLAEMLRAYLIQTPRITEVVELMHGVGSLQSEQLFEGHLAAGSRHGEASKHVFVPQIPNLPLHGVFGERRAHAPRAVNAYLNNYFVQANASPAQVEEQVVGEYDRLVAGCRTPAPGIITIFGNYPHDGHLWDSPTFHAEYLLITLIKELRAQLATETVITYVPHPLYRAVTAHPVFASNDVRIQTGPVPAWLLADRGVSLVSSTMFEATHFGVHMHTPILTSDGFFHEDYMHLVSHPASASIEDFRAGIARWMDGVQGVARPGVVQRIRQRLEIMGWSETLVIAAPEKCAESLVEGTASGAV